MGKPYSIDLRERVVAAVSTGGLSCNRAAKQFEIGISTAINWVNRLRRPATFRRARSGATSRRRLLGALALALRRTKDGDFTCAALWPNSPNED